MANIKLKVNQDVVEKLKKSASDYLFDIGEEVEEVAKQLCPRDSGRLANSIDTLRKDDDTVSVGSDVGYALIVEFGSRYQPAQSFLRAAISRIKSQHQ